MNLYHCMIELKDGAKALAFAGACEAWMGRLQEQGVIRSWRLLRRKFGLASGSHPDFLLEIEVEGMAALEAAFAALSGAGGEEERLYDRVHQMVARADVGLYRPYPDPAQRERIAFV